MFGDDDETIRESVGPGVTEKLGKERDSRGEWFSSRVEDGDVLDFRAEDIFEVVIKTVDDEHLDSDVVVSPEQQQLFIHGLMLLLFKTELQYGRQSVLW